jgi:hypothetical protein
MRPKKGSVRAFRPYGETLNLAKQICEATGLQQATLFAISLQAALEAIARDGFQVTLPLHFQVVPNEKGKANSRIPSASTRASATH